MTGLKGRKLLLRKQVVQNEIGKMQESDSVHYNSAGAARFQVAVRNCYPMFVRILPVSALLLGFLATVDGDSLKTGKAFQDALLIRITNSSQALPLRDQLETLQKNGSISILCDRRTDPRQVVSLETNSVPRIQVLKQISSAIPETAVIATDRLVYLGPAVATLRLPVLLDQTQLELKDLRRNAAPAAWKSLNAQSTWSWQELDEPRGILAAWATRAGIRVSNLEVLPHDVWGPGVLPRMTFPEAATILLNQFDLKPEFRGKDLELTLIPVNGSSRLVRTYLVDTGIRNPVLKSWESIVGGNFVQWSGARATISATLNEHARLNAVVWEHQLAAIMPEQNGPAVSAIRSQLFQVKGQAQSLRQIIQYFRMNRISITVQDEQSVDVQKVLNQTMDLNTVSEKLPGSKFFPTLFGRHFSRVQVFDDRVELSL